MTCFRTMVVALALLTAACDDDKTAAPPPAGPPAVTVAQPLSQQITEWDEFTGRFEAMETIELRARVSGYLESIHFRDGQIVEKGDKLFVIDQRRFRIAVDQAKAQIEQARAQLALARSDVQRARPLAQRRTIPARELEAREAAQKEASARLAAAQASLRQAELELEWTEVRAPITGRVSNARIDVGNLVTGGAGGNATLLTTIVSLDPIHFVFEGSEADYLKYIRLDRTGQRQSARTASHPVAVRLIDEDSFRHRGRMDFVDNRVDPNSGTIRARAIFENPDALLTPGVFGRLRLYGGESDALLLPDSAIASDQANKIVMTVADDNTVTMKVVTLGPIVDGLRVVRTGLAPTDRVIINGIQRAQAGARVEPEQGTITPDSAKGADGGAPDGNRQYGQ